MSEPVKNQAKDQQQGKKLEEALSVNQTNEIQQNPKKVTATTDRKPLCGQLIPMSFSN